LLRKAMKMGHIRSAYSLGLILRDSFKTESNNMLEYAAERGFLPAAQELYDAKKMHETFGPKELTAPELQKVSILDNEYKDSFSVNIFGEPYTFEFAS